MGREDSEKTYQSYKHSSCTQASKTQDWVRVPTMGSPDEHRDSFMVLILRLTVQSEWNTGDSSRWHNMHSKLGYQADCLLQKVLTAKFCSRKVEWAAVNSEKSKAPADSPDDLPQQKLLSLSSRPAPLVPNCRILLKPAKLVILDVLFSCPQATEMVLVPAPFMRSRTWYFTSLVLCLHTSCWLPKISAPPFGVHVTAIMTWGTRLVSITHHAPMVRGFKYPWWCNWVMYPTSPCTKVSRRAPYLRKRDPCGGRNPYP